MPNYNEATARPQGHTLITPEVSTQIIQELTQRSAALNLFRRINIRGRETSFPVLSQLPMAYWLEETTTAPTASADHPNSDATLIPTTHAEWSKVTMKVADLATVIPIPRRFAADVQSTSGINVTDELRPLIVEALGQKIDAAAIFGIDKPDSWPDSLVEGAIDVDRSASSATYAPNGNNIITIGATAEEGGLASDAISVMAVLADQGYTPNAILARSTFKFKLMNARDTTGQPLLDINSTSLFGERIVFGGDGVWPADAPEGVQLIALDTTKVMLGVRQDIEITRFDTGVINDAAGNIVFNLLQQDMIALRATMRVGFAVANPVSRAESNIAKRWPAAALVRPAETP